MAPPTPSRFGKYELLARLAKGGMAETFRAQLIGAAGVTKQVVIKKVLPHLAEDEAFVASFIDEAKISASLSHGNIAQVFDFGRVGGDYFLAMELVDGRSLAEVLDRAASKGFTKVPVPIACFLAIEVLKGLHYAHTRQAADGEPLQLVHRDVSPENVLVSFEGQTKVVDFGVAKAAMRGRAETEPGLVKGKFQFFSPEQACAEPLDGRSDVFAVGVVLYRMACGQLPFEGQMHNVMRAIVSGRWIPPTVVHPELPPALAAIIDKAMATDRSRRYPSALLMQEALSSFLYRQEPSFSGETVKEWMHWLFRPELEAERRNVSLSPRFLAQLEKWDPKLMSTAPAGVAAVTREGAPGLRRAGKVWLLAGTLALVGAGVGVGMLSGAGKEPRAAPVVEANPLDAPIVDDVSFPATATIVASRHRLRLEQVSLPSLSVAKETMGKVSEPAPALGLSPLFALATSNRIAVDGQVGVVLRRGATVPAFASLKLFDFQPFRNTLGGQQRTLRLGDGSPPKVFSDGAALIDSRSGAWVTVHGVFGRVKLTLTPLSPAVWAARPRRASVVVAWQRAPGARSFDDTDWPQGIDRTVLVHGKPLIVDGAASFAFAFADAFATSERDSVAIAFEPTDEPPNNPAELALLELPKTAVAAVAPAPSPVVVEPVAPRPKLTMAQRKEKIAAAKQAIEQLDWSKAQEILETCYVGEAMCPEAAALAQLMSQERDTKNALQNAERALGLNDLAAASIELGKARQSKLLAKRHKQISERWNAMSVAEKRAPTSAVDNGNFLLLQAKQEMSHQGYENAKSLLEECIRLSPKNAECHKFLGATWGKLNNPKKHLRHYKEFLRLAPADHPERADVQAIIEGKR